MGGCSTSLKTRSSLDDPTEPTPQVYSGSSISSSFSTSQNDGELEHGHDDDDCQEEKDEEDEHDSAVLFVLCIVPQFLSPADACSFLTAFPQTRTPSNLRGLIDCDFTDDMEVQRFLKESLGLKCRGDMQLTIDPSVFCGLQNLYHLDFSHFLLTQCLHFNFISIDSISHSQQKRKTSAHLPMAVKKTKRPKTAVVSIPCFLPPDLRQLRIDSDTRVGLVTGDFPPQLTLLRMVNVCVDYCAEEFLQLLFELKHLEVCRVNNCGLSGALRLNGRLPAALYTLNLMNNAIDELSLEYSFWEDAQRSDDLNIYLRGNPLLKKETVLAVGPHIAVSEHCGRVVLRSKSKKFGLILSEVRLDQILVVQSMEG